MDNGGPDFLWLFIKMLIVLAVVLGGVLVTLRYVLPRTRWGRARMGGWAEVVARAPLEPRKQLLLVKLAGRYLVLGSSEQAVTLLTELSRTEGEALEKIP